MRNYFKQINGFTLAEGATHVTSLPSKAKGFTLAEVLITIGTIGIIAAITIPGLIQNYQYRAWTKQLQKTYATLNQGFRRMLAEENADLLSQTETFNSISFVTDVDSEKRCYPMDTPDSQACKEFYKNFGKYFKIADIKKFTAFDNYRETNLNSSNPSNPYTNTAITLLDGTMITDPEFWLRDQKENTDNPMKEFVGQFKIDVNGPKRPNKFGRDIFWFYLGDNGIVYPFGSMAVSEYVCGNTTACYWKTSTHPEYTCENNSNSLGHGCAARVLETGNMEYPKVQGSGSGS